MKNERERYEATEGRKRDRWRERLEKSLQSVQIFAKNIRVFECDKRTRLPSNEAQVIEMFLIYSLAKRFAFYKWWCLSFN